jgi:hypothetical protein
MKLHDTGAIFAVIRINLVELIRLRRKILPGAGAGV